MHVQYFSDSVTWHAWLVRMAFLYATTWIEIDEIPFHIAQQQSIAKNCIFPTHTHTQDINFPMEYKQSTLCASTVAGCLNERISKQFLIVNVRRFALRLLTHLFNSLFSHLHINQHSIVQSTLPQRWQVLVAQCLSVRQRVSRQPMPVARRSLHHHENEL